MYSSVKITKNTSANSLQLRDFSLSGNPIIIRGKAGVNSPCHFLKVLISQAFQTITQILPWQIKSTRILMFFSPKKAYFAVICRVLPLSKMYKVLLQCQATLIFRTYLDISWQYKANRYTHS